MEPKVVAFGKYKGRSVDELVADTSYTEWLQAQDWFRLRHVDLYQVIINRGAEPQDTPEHNALQARFLDDDLCLRLAEIVEPGCIDRGRRMAEFYRREAIKYGGYAAEKEMPASTEIELRVGRKFEEGGIDVQLKITVRYKARWGLSEIAFLGGIELKPTVGDDYPAVLRQMNANKSRVLVLERYTGQGATREQFVKMFLASDKHVVFLSEIDLHIPYRNPTGANRTEVISNG